MPGVGNPHHLSRGQLIPESRQVLPSLVTCPIVITATHSTRTAGSAIRVLSAWGGFSTVHTVPHAPHLNFTLTHTHGILQPPHCTSHLLAFAPSHFQKYPTPLPGSPKCTDASANIPTHACKQHIPLHLAH